MIKEKWIDLDSLPHNKSQINWKESVGHTVAFKYGDIEDCITIAEWVSSKEIIVEYNGKRYPMHKSGIMQVKFGILLGEVNYDWKYDVGQHIIHNKSGESARIIDRYKRPTAFSQGARFYKLICDCCQQLYDKLENEVEKRGCPVCHGDVVVKGINDLWTTHPHIAQQLKNLEDGYKVSYGQRIYLDWICPSCGEEVKHKSPMYIINAKNEQVPCEKCSDSYSFPNKFFFNLLKEINVDFEIEKNFKWKKLGRRKYDFYIPQYDMIVEIHGGQHYDPRFPKIRENDIEKKEIALENNISHYVEIEANRSNGDYIFKNVVDELSDYFDFSSVNVDKVSLQASKKIADVVLELLEKYNYDEKKVFEEIKIDRATISRYLNSAIRSGILNEEMVRKKQLQNKIDKHYQLDSKPIRNKDTGNVFGNYIQVGVWFKENGRKTFSIGNIKDSMQRDNGNGTAYGYHWDFISREEFNRIKEMNPDLAYGDFFENVGC